MKWLTRLRPCLFTFLYPDVVAYRSLTLNNLSKFQLKTVKFFLGWASLCYSFVTVNDSASEKLLKFPSLWLYARLPADSLHAWVELFLWLDKVFSPCSCDSKAAFLQYFTSNKISWNQKWQIKPKRFHYLVGLECKCYEMTGLALDLVRLILFSFFIRTKVKVSVQSQMFSLV